MTQCSAIEWSLLILCFSVVIGLETMNTALEKNCDMTTTYYSREIRIIKDVAAGAVFFASVCSAVIGSIILLPKILELI
jgi:diacylglycerol kinase